ncbi:MAG: deoxyguanosinetriphosphate triphosphohydrolase [SAR202 cluster bacterium]|nr:deoxyguanosinetriphosphate triphosphohydrolase [SAR202 cluster bacterium]
MNIPESVRNRLEAREETLSPYASRSRNSTRERHDEPSLIRTEFQRDRDRIIHTKAFRRLKHKTQVFIAPLGDHFVTRLTHTLEVSQIGRTIARALNLNEDLTEAMTLGHDLGHTPFGHIGEDELAKLHPDGFRHAQQSLRIIEHLEKDGLGLNLTGEVRHGIANHSKPKGDFLGITLPEGLSLEGQICRIADAVAYLNHDIGDAVRAGVLQETSLPAAAVRVLGTRHSQRIDTMVTDIVATSWAATGEDGVSSGERPVITMSPRVRDAVMAMRDFMFERVYMPEDTTEEGRTARAIIRLLYRYFEDNPGLIPAEYGTHDRAIVDHIASMTDLYALRLAEQIQPGIAKGLSRAIA